MSTLMFWNKQNANSNNSNGQANDAKNGKKEWLHSPDALVNGHVAYLVKFLGATPVDQAKGIETVKDAIRRLQFSQQIKKAEGNGNKKSNKVELTISVDGVAVQEPRVQKVLHQFPLHDISYCADEKGVKKFFSFIAKTSKRNTNGTNGTAADINGTDPNTNNKSASTTTEDTHTCFVFISSKLASDITMTIGQAFELAYRRYVSDGSKGTEVQKLQAHAKQLEHSVQAYQQRLRDLVDLVPRTELTRLLAVYGVRDILEVQPLPMALPMDGGLYNGVGMTNGGGKDMLGSDVLATNGDDQLLIETSSKMQFGPMVPPRNQIQNQINSTLDAFKPSVGTKLEGLLLHSDSDSDFDPRADESDASSSITNGNGGGSGDGSKLINDLFGFEPSKTMGQQLFASNGNGNGNGMGMASTNGIGTTAQLTNGNRNGYAASPPPLLAPPPKAVTQRRPVAANNNNNSNNHNNNNLNGSQDLFGSTPFNAMQPSPFDDDFTEKTNTPTVDAFGTILSESTLNARPKLAIAASNPFGDNNETIDVDSSSSFDTSDFGGATFGGVPSIAVDPYAALVNSSGGSSSSTANGSHQLNSSSELSGINFGSTSIGSSDESRSSGGGIDSKSSPATAATTSSTSTACKPNYQAFYSVSTSAFDKQPASSFDGGEKSPKNATAIKPALDIFQSVAASAFQQFGNAIPSGGGFVNATKKNPTAVATEPVASMAMMRQPDANVVGVSSSTPKTKEMLAGGFAFVGDQNQFNIAKTMPFDDFTLESLDPLRK